MGDERGGWKLVILAGDDALRQERLTRALRDELSTIDGLTVEFIDGLVEAQEGHKGGAIAEVALWVGMAAVARPASQLLITTIKEWCAKERHRKVEITRGDGSSIVLVGRPDKAQERMVDKFLVGSHDDGNTSDPGAAE